MKERGLKRAGALFEHRRATDQPYLFSNKHRANIRKALKGKKKLPSTVPKSARQFGARSSPPRYVPKLARRRRARSVDPQKNKQSDFVYY